MIIILSLWFHFKMSTYYKKWCHSASFCVVMPFYNSTSLHTGSWQVQKFDSYQDSKRSLFLYNKTWNVGFKNTRLKIWVLHTNILRIVSIKYEWNGFVCDQQSKNRVMLIQSFSFGTLSSVRTFWYTASEICTVIWALVIFLDDFVHNAMFLTTSESLKRMNSLPHWSHL